MPAPALKIPVSVDLDGFKDGMDRAASRVGQTVKLIGAQFEKLNAGIAAGSTAGAAGIASGYASTAAKVVGSFGLMATGAAAAGLVIAGAIHEAREQIEKMVEVSDKARNVGLDPEGFQKFLLVAKQLKVEASDLEGALTAAFQATKEKSPVDLTKWETAGERITEVEKALRVYNLEAQKAGQQLQGLVLFRDADNQKEKILAVLQAMVQLNAMGKTLESLDLGEKMFKPAFIDRIRQGKTTAEEILKTMQAASVAGGDIFSNAQIQRAKDIDIALEKAHQTLTKNLKPAWDGLATVALNIKNLWVRIVELMGDAAGAFNFFSNAAELKRLKGDLDNVNEALKNQTALFGLPALSGWERTKQWLEVRKAELEALIAAMERPGVPRITVTRGAGAAPTKTDAGGRDRFDAAADSIDKRTAALKAENDTIDEGTEARNRARIVAELQAVAMQINKEAGLGEGVVTAEQTERLNKLADAYGKAAAKIEQARSPLAAFARESANIGAQLNRFATDSLNNLTNEMAAVVVQTTTVKEAFNRMTVSILQDLARIALRASITGPLSGWFNSLFGGTGGIFNVSGGIFNVSGGSSGGSGGEGRNAAGTDYWRGGPTWVGEKGPEIVNLPRGSQVIPNNVASKMGAVNIQGAAITINAPGADAAGLARVEQAVVKLNQSLESRAIHAVRDARARRAM